MQAVRSFLMAPDDVLRVMDTEKYWQMINSFLPRREGLLILFSLHALRKAFFFVLKDSKELRTRRK